MIIDTWALDTLTICASYFVVMAGTSFMLDTINTTLRYKAIAAAVPAALSAIKIGVKEKTDE